jgi:O-antigen ligase
LAAGSLESPIASASPATSTSLLSRVIGWTIPVTFALVFVTYTFQPRVTRGDATVDLADLAVLATVVAALLTVRREGLARLKASLWLWVVAGAFVVYVAAASIYPLAFDSRYHWPSHLLTAAKWGEYAVLAPALAVLLRTERDVRRLLGTVAGWAALAGGVGLLQAAGLHIFAAWPFSTGREPSFTGIAEFGTLGAAALAVGFVGLLWPGAVGRRTTIAALAGGVIGVVLSAAAASGLGLGIALVGVVLLCYRRGSRDLRRIAVVATITAVCAGGIIVLRSVDISQFERDLGILKSDRATTHSVQTYAQRSLMIYLGLRVWEAHPVFGAGWQGFKEPQVYGPFLAAAHRHFPNQPEFAFPSATRPWRIDNAYVEALAELGVVGLALFVGTFGTAVVMGARGVLGAADEPAQWMLVGLLWVLVSFGVWAGEGLVAGVSYTALPWLGVGLVAAGRARRADVRAGP